MASISKAKASRVAKLTGKAASERIRVAACAQGKLEAQGAADMLEAVKACDISTPANQDALRADYIAGRFMALGIEMKAAYALVTGEGWKASGTTARTNGRAKLTEEQDRNRTTFRKGWSRLLEKAGVQTVKNVAKRGTSEAKAKQAKTQADKARTSGKVATATKAVAASPKVSSIKGAFQHVRQMAGFLNAFALNNADLKGFDPYRALIMDFVEKVNKLPAE